MLGHNLSLLKENKSILLFLLNLYSLLIANMELSTSSNVPGIVFNDQARNLIEELTQLDALQTANKELIFERLYTLWTSDGVGQITVLRTRFDEQQNFIKESIVRSFDQDEQRHREKVKLILETLKSGNDFVTPEGNIIVSTPHEIEEWQGAYKGN